MEVDETIQRERDVKFDFHTAVYSEARNDDPGESRRCGPREFQQGQQVKTQREPDRGELRRRRPVPRRAQTVVVFSKPW